MKVSDKWKEMVTASERVIEDFNDFADDRATVWADNQIKQLTEESARLLSYCETLEKLRTRDQEAYNKALIEIARLRSALKMMRGFYPEFCDEALKEQSITSNVSEVKKEIFIIEKETPAFGGWGKSIFKTVARFEDRGDAEAYLSNSGYKQAGSKLDIYWCAQLNGPGIGIELSRKYKNDQR